MKWRDITDHDLEDALASVKHSYDPEAARSLIEYFHERFNNGHSYNERILREFVALAFERMVQQEWSADHAFGLKLKRGKYQRESTVERDVSYAAYITLLLRNNWKYFDAVIEAGYSMTDDADGASERVVERAYSLYKDELELCTDQILLEMLPDGVTIPNPR